LKGLEEETLMGLIHDMTGRYPSFQTPPRPHQLEGLAFALLLERALLFYGMRLGKTKIALDWAQHLKSCGRWSGMGLVIAHAPIGLDVWRNEIAKHSKLHAVVIHHDRELLIKTIAEPVDLMIMTWSSMYRMFAIKKKVTRGKRKGEDKLYPDRPMLRLLSGAIDLVIIDETQECKNYAGLPFAIAEELVASARFRLGLTGTPFGRNPYDLWAQAKLIDDGQALGTNPMFFKEAFGQRKYHHFAKGNSTTAFDKKKQPLLAKRMAAVAMSYARSEVVTDNVQSGVTELNMHGAQLAAYNECIDKAIKLEGIADPLEIGNVFSRLRMIASGYLPWKDQDGEDRLVYFPEDVKAHWLEEMLGEEPVGPTIIFHEYIETGRHICKQLERLKKPHVWLWGGTPNREMLRLQFQSGKIDYFVANTKSGGVAIDLNRADYLLYYESCTSPITRAQSEARPLAEREGRLLTMEDLICSPTERRILGFIAEGVDMLDKIIVKRDYKKLLQSLKV
jgi:SNF2 family DNA or RNA helicase